MSNATDGARIKVWPGVQSALSGDLQGGGGSGMVRDVLYDGMVIQNVDYGIEITGCYGQSNLTLCNEFPVGFYLLLFSLPRPFPIPFRFLRLQHL